MSIVVNTDFKGEYSISQTCYDELDLYIEKLEKSYLIHLLGAELYDLFIADLTMTDPQEPQTARFIELFSPFFKDDGSCIRRSEGIRKMLVQFIYFHYVRDSNHKKDVTGVVVNYPENSKMSPYAGYNLVESYNEGVKNYRSIQWLICDTNDYPEENTQYIYFTSGI